MATPAEKRALTREINQQQACIKDLKETHERQGNKLRFWYLGDSLTKFDIYAEERELQRLQQKRKEFNK